MQEIWRYNYKNGEIVKTNERRKNIKIEEFIETLNISSFEVIDRSKFKYKNRVFKILQILNDTKHVNNKEERVIDKKWFLSKWDTEKDLNFDFAILVYNAGDKYINILVPKEEMLQQNKREPNFFMTMEDIVDFYKLESKKNISLRTTRNEKRLSKGTVFKSSLFKSLIK